ncbi:MAG: hypothetical protein R3F55_00195 [Alphaproteobacteria bacterium]
MKWSIVLLVCLTLKFATGCARSPVETATGACDAFGPIHPTPADADAISIELARQLVAHDDKGRALGCW